MNNKRVAAIDLGTNTFHLLIAEQQGNKFFELDRERIWVNLAEFGMESFNPTVEERIMNAISKFKVSLQQLQVAEVKCVATEGFRSASNGSEVLGRIADHLSVIPEIIPGKREAELIYKGVSLVVPGSAKMNLIMDIGGGSTEFILYDHTGIRWSGSFKAGVTYLFNRFVTSDPLSGNDQGNLLKYLEDILSELIGLKEKFEIDALIGASGSFEVLEMMSDKTGESWKVNQLSIRSFRDHLSAVVHTSLEERLGMVKIPDARARLIVVAFIFIAFIVDNLRPGRIIISPFAMKEGIIKEMLNI